MAVSPIKPAYRFIKLTIRIICINAVKTCSCISKLQSRFHISNDLLY